jgi:hypothetical protein
MPPFVVFSLPRSRSAWLSVLLSSPGAICGHDIGPTLRSPEEFGERLNGELAGTCETGAAFAWRQIWQMLPDANFVVIRRDPQAVVRSLDAFGISGQDEEMRTRSAQLDEISAIPGTLTLEADELADEAACAMIYAHCLGRKMPSAWWAHLDHINIQVDMRRQLQLLAERRPQIEALKAQVRAHV